MNTKAPKQLKSCQKVTTQEAMNLLYAIRQAIADIEKITPDYQSILSGSTAITGVWGVESVPGTMGHPKREAYWNPSSKWLTISKGLLPDVQHILY